MLTICSCLAVAHLALPYGNCMCRWTGLVLPSHLWRKWVNLGDSNSSGEDDSTPKTETMDEMNFEDSSDNGEDDSTPTTDKLDEMSGQTVKGSPRATTSNKEPKGRAYRSNRNVPTFQYQIKETVLSGGRKECLL